MDANRLTCRNLCGQCANVRGIFVQDDSLYLVQPEKIVILDHFLARMLARKS